MWDIGFRLYEKHKETPQKLNQTLFDYKCIKYRHHYQYQRIQYEFNHSVKFKIS